MKKFFINEVIHELYTIKDMLRWAVSRFNSSNIFYGHGTNHPLDEAKRLILPSLFLPLDIPSNMFDARLVFDEKRHIIERIIRRIDERIPVAYLTNKAWFCGYEFYVDNRVLIPRSPIGEFVDNYFFNLIHQQPNQILDMCTGSGCIAIVCAYLLPEAKIDAVDVSIDALSVAEFNIKKHDLTQNITLICSDLFHNLPKKEYDLILANPPYVSKKDIFNLPDEYHHEPKLSLESGKDGLELTNKILTCSSEYLSKEGVLVCEVGNNMIKLIKKYPTIPFTWLEFKHGGEGVFMLNKTQLIASNTLFHKTE